MQKKQQLRTQEGGMLLLDAVSNQCAYFNRSYNSVKFNNNIKLNIVIKIIPSDYFVLLSHPDAH